MATNAFELKPIMDGMAIPTPRKLTCREEAAILSQAKLAFDPVASELECLELLRQREQGRLVSAEVMLKKMDELEAQHRNTPREPE